METIAYVNPMYTVRSEHRATNLDACPLKIDAELNTEDLPSLYNYQALAFSKSQMRFPGSAVLTSWPAEHDILCHANAGCLRHPGRQRHDEASAAFHPCQPNTAGQECTLQCTLSWRDAL